MKKFWIGVLSFLLVLTILPTIASAQAQLSYVTDTCGLLNERQIQDLEARGQDLAEKYGVAVYTIIVNDFTNYVRTDSVKTAADTFYDDYGLGCGEEHEGVLLLLSMAERDFAIICAGSFCEYALPDRVLDNIDDYFLDNFRQNDWYRGLCDYYSSVENVVEQNIEGYRTYRQRLDSGNILYDGGRSPAVNLLLLLGIPALIAGITCMVFAGQMRNAKIRTTAGEYIDSNSLQFDIRQDRFLHRTESRQVIESNSKSGSGGGGGGHVGHSGKF